MSGRRGRVGNAKTFYHLNNFPSVSFHTNVYPQVLSLSLFFSRFYFIFTNAQTFLPQIILGQVTSRKAVWILDLTKRGWSGEGQRSCEIFWLCV